MISSIFITLNKRVEFIVMHNFENLNQSIVIVSQAVKGFIPMDFADQCGLWKIFAIVNYRLLAIETTAHYLFGKCYVQNQFPNTRRGRKKMFGGHLSIDAVENAQQAIAIQASPSKAPSNCSFILFISFIDCVSRFIRI